LYPPAGQQVDQIRPLGDADEQLPLHLSAATISRRAGRQLQAALLEGPVNMTFENPVVSLHLASAAPGPCPWPRPGEAGCRRQAT
jgi:hypothetical protein